MIKETIKVKGMSCSHCVKSVERALSPLKLESYKVVIGSAEVSYNPDYATAQEIIDAIQNAGYKVIG